VEFLVREWGGDASWRIDGSAHPHEAGLLRLDSSKAERSSAGARDYGYRTRWLGLQSGTNRTPRAATRAICAARRSTPISRVEEARRSKLEVGTETVRVTHGALAPRATDGASLAESARPRSCDARRQLSAVIVPMVIRADEVKAVRIAGGEHDVEIHDVQAARRKSSRSSC